MIFVDTSGWYAAYVPTDPHHTQVKPLIDQADTKLSIREAISLDQHFHQISGITVHP
jgi:predicted nucleic acid-binding protein